MGAVNKINLARFLKENHAKLELAYQSLEVITSSYNHVTTPWFL